MNLLVELAKHLEVIVEPDHDKSGLVASIAELDRVAKEQSKDLPGQLLHFLQRRSYEKALMYLRGEENIPKGICGGKH